MKPKSTPKLLPEGQNVAQKRCWISDAILASIFSLFGDPKRPSKRHPKSLKIRPPRPRAAQRPPGTPPEASTGSHFGLILGTREAILEPFKRPFRSLRAPHHTIENTVRNHFPKDPLRPLRDRCAQHRRLSGRFGAAGPLEIRPLSRSGSLEAVSEARCRSRKHCDKHSFGNPASTVGRLPKSPLPPGPPPCRWPQRP